VRIAVPALLALLALIGVVPSKAAFGHASLVSTEPADGAIVAAAPETVTLVFNEPVSPLVLRLFDPSGHGAVLSDIRQDGPRLAIAVPRALGEGTYVLSWRVVSADGHAVSGAFGYSVGRVDGAARLALETAASAPVRAGLWLTRFALYVALFVGVGGAFFSVWVAADRPLPGRAEPVIVATIWIGLAILPLAVGLQGLDALGVSLAELRRPAVWTTGLATSYGTTAVGAALALLAGFFAVEAPQPALARRLSALALIGVGFALAASGHAAAAEPQWLMRLAVFVHAVAVAFWVGALVPLAACLRARDDNGRRTLLRFSRAIPYAIVPLVVAGIVLAAVQLGRVDALWTTSYGLVLLGKLAAVAALFALAAVNRIYLTPRIAAHDGGAQANLLRSIAAECAVVLAILALVTGWRFTPPPRALAQAAVPAAIHVHGPRAYAHIALSLQKPAGIRATLRITDPALNELHAKEVTVAISNQTAGIEPIRRTAVSIGGGRWQVDDLRIPVAGQWRVRVDILVSDFEKIVLEQTAELPRMP
jgi:copper transport protein